MRNEIKLLLLFFFLQISCTPDKELNYPNLVSYVFYEDFLKNTEAGQDIAIDGWINYSEKGTVKWQQGIYSGTKYAQFSGYKSGEDSNIGWLVSPPISMDDFEYETLVFDVAQAYVSNQGNSIEVLISTDFGGTNIKFAHWESLSFLEPPIGEEFNYIFYSSGLIDLSQYEGEIVIAFKVIGSGRNTNLDGTYQIDNIRIFDHEK